MERGRSSHRGLIIAVILLIVILSAAVGVLVSMGYFRPHRVVVITSEKPAPKPPANDYTAASSWKVFVDEARSKCEKEDANCTVDYTALHEYGQSAYGAMIVGYKDSEYIIDLYRYDPSARDWTPAPKRAKMDGYEVIDTAAASQAWGVPEETLDAWITEAEKAVQRVYERRAQQENKH